ncbi:hypothetical protein AMAG_14279 [Allomyces macrogynus ATCC 38327]|uniref:Uncharacterized protein n=1 Tax=Allomyces macrogynus (strain ATCC 38327) TaxID=578462 RepID=A0A0L0T4R9_ALLM3|nr:hypothetical protein AMAG_14279 [Allomyces macrogynus ATCC 38327]|eukprot:KNE69737.1 hypothetical protein AMAG_14279 [Allomyces macrogynus ATCC 38327]
MGGGPKQSSMQAKLLGGGGERSTPPTDSVAAAPAETATARAAQGPEMRLTAGLHNALVNYTYAPDASTTAEHVSSSMDPAWSQRCQSLAHLPRVSRPYSAALLTAALVALLAATTALAAPVVIHGAAYEQITADETLVLKSTVDTLREPRRSRFDRVIAFGDTSTDSDNVFNLTKGAWPVPESYAQGRFSNGRTSRTSRAMSSRSARPFCVTLRLVEPRRIPRWCRGNDLFFSDAAISPDTLANNLIRAVEANDDIHAHTDHARMPHILLLGMSDFNYMPYFATLDDESRAKFIAANEAFNAALAKHVQCAAAPGLSSCRPRMWCRTFSRTRRDSGSRAARL